MIQKQSGFTFIELILCMVLSAILAGVVVEIIAGPIRAYFWYTQRNQYVDMAQMSLESIQSDMQSSLPSSIGLKRQEQGQSLQFRNIIYKGIVVPNGKTPSRDVMISTELPENLLLTKQQQELFMVFPAVTRIKDKFYPFTISKQENRNFISLPESFIVKYPTPFYIVSGLTTYEYVPEKRSLERIMMVAPDRNQKSLLSNEVSDCWFTLLEGKPQRVLVSLSFGAKQSQVTLSQPMMVGDQL